MLIGIHEIDNGPTYIVRFSNMRIVMHLNSRSRIDFNDSTYLSK